MELSQRRKTKRSAFRSYRLSFPIIGFGKSLEKLNQHRFFCATGNRFAPKASVSRGSYVSATLFPVVIYMRVQCRINLNILGYVIHRQPRR